jgi:non-specific serine/threonine protein kinase
MILDYANDQIILQEEKNENFLKIQDNSDFVFCHRLRRGKYHVPFVSLPILIKTLKKIKYPIRPTQALKDHLEAFKKYRQMLQDIKDGKTNNPEVQKIYHFCEQMEKEYGFKLYDLQKETIAFGVLGQTDIIANEIGTGKTLCAIMIGMYLKSIKKIDRCLILLPASLVGNFKDDYEKFFGKAGLMTISTQTKAKREQLYRDFKVSKSTTFLLTNFEKCLYDYNFLKSIKFDMVVVDEFHVMKNFISAQRSINFFEMLEKYWIPKYRIPMSGTPIENRLFDLFPIMKFLDGGKILGGQKFFETNFIEYKEFFFKVKGVLFREEKPVDFKNHDFLKNLIRPITIRKKLNLPVALYKKIIKIEPSKEILDKISELKMLADSPAKRYHAIRQFLCDTNREGIDDNPKLAELENIFMQTSEKILIFSFYKCSIRKIAEFLESKGYRGLTCSGDDKKDPFEVVKEFKTNPDLKFLVTTDKINYGHNIQCAKIVIEWELPLKPTVSKQRFGRAYRSGQDQNVLAFSFVTMKTVEETIYKQYMQKCILIEEVIETLDFEISEDDENEIEKNVLKQFM